MTSTDIHHCVDTTTTIVPHVTSLKTCSQQITSYLCRMRQRTLYHRSIGTMSIPDLNLVPADIVNKTQVHCSAKYQINPYKACSSENALTRTTEQSVMPSKPLPNNASHGFTYRFTNIHKYQQFWTEDILNTTQPNQKESRKRPNQ